MRRNAFPVSRRTLMPATLIAPDVGARRPPRIRRVVVFAGAIVTEKSKDVSGLEIQREVVDGADGSVAIFGIINLSEISRMRMPLPWSVGSSCLTSTFDWPSIAQPERGENRRS